MTEFLEVFAAFYVGIVVGMIVMAGLVLHKLNKLKEEALVPVRTTVQDLNPRKYDQNN